MTDRERPDRLDPRASLLGRVTEIWAGLSDADPRRLAADTGASYTPTDGDSGDFRLPVWGRAALVAHPGFETTWAEDGETVDAVTAALLAYYFATSDGAPETGHRIAFGELRDGTFYTQAFQGYTGEELAKAFGNDVDAFTTAARSIGGRPEPLADRAFAFRALPLVSAAVACWVGDEDFGPSYRILFDAAVGHHLPTGVCAIVGSSLTRRLIAAGDRSREAG